MPKGLHVTVLFRGKQLRSSTYHRDRIVIGRDAECDLRLFNVGVSRHHALIVRNEAGYELRDLGSSNGTYSSDRRVTIRQIEDGDRLRITKFELVFNLVDTPIDGVSMADECVSGFGEERTMSLSDD